MDGSLVLRAVERSERRSAGQAEGQPLSQWTGHSSLPALEQEDFDGGTFGDGGAVGEDGEGVGIGHGAQQVAGLTAG